MTKTDDTIGVARDHRWMRLAEQQRQLKECSRVVVVLGDSSGRDHGKKAPYALEDLVRLTRPGTVVQFMYAFLLADPSKRRQQAEFERSLSLIEKRGGVVRDVLTGLSTETKDKRRALVLSVADQIRRSGQGKSSGENGKLSRGRPKTWTDPNRRQIIWEEWHSNANHTNISAAKAASRRIGEYVSHNSMWRVVKEMRAERGLTGKGASGRRPNSAAAQLVASLGAPSEDGPKAPKPKRGVVYFIRNGVRDRVKIGFSERHDVRLSSLQGASPDKLVLIGVLPGTVKLERRMHKKFKEYRESGEWFRVEGTLASYLRVTFPKFKRT